MGSCGLPHDRGAAEARTSGGWLKSVSLASREVKLGRRAASETCQKPCETHSTGRRCRCRRLSGGAKRWQAGSSQNCRGDRFHDNARLARPDEHEHARMSCQKLGGVWIGSTSEDRGEAIEAMSVASIGLRRCNSWLSMPSTNHCAMLDPA